MRSVHRSRDQDSEKGGWSKALRSNLSLSLFAVYFFLAVLGLLLLRAFSSFRERGLLSVAVRASHLSGFSWGGAQALGCPGSAVALRVPAQAQ